MAEMSARAGTPDDVGLVHQRLMEAIDTSEFHGDLFKSYEKRRFSKTFLRTLMAIDPWHVLILESKGNSAGFMISGPDCGSIFQYWSYVFPEYRRSTLALFGMRFFAEHWDNGRFHKASTYTRPGNTIAIKLLERYDYKQVALLEKHIFGDDYLVFERPYTKTVEGYDMGVQVDTLTRWKLRLRGFFDR